MKKLLLLLSTCIFFNVGAQTTEKITINLTPEELELLISDDKSIEADQMKNDLREMMNQVMAHKNNLKALAQEGYNLSSPKTTYHLPQGTSILPDQIPDLINTDKKKWDELLRKWGNRGPLAKEICVDKCTKVCVTVSD